MKLTKLALMGTFLLAPFAATAEPDLTKVEIAVTKVAGNVYLLQGSDAGNMAASVGEDGIVRPVVLNPC